ncbi:hypothetical protein ACK3SF_00270 [Candidatus Nanosalina sp. VS9-1]|uniref:hypothetical protein n=1 Tax=Candidatus Nanosalina sp. VS9-1 TaxID=3388566 RepID=UPI0039E11D95
MELADFSLKLSVSGRHWTFMQASRKFLVLILALAVFLSAASAGTLSTYRDIVETEVHQLYANELSNGTYELEADAYAGDDQRNSIYAAYITDNSPSDYRNFSFYLEEQANTNHNFHLTTYWLHNGSLSDIGTDDFEQLKDFNQPPAGTTYYTNLTDRNEDYGKVAVVVEGTHYWYEDDYLRVVVSNISSPDAGTSICDSRGPLNECIATKSHDIGGRNFDISSIFQSKSSAVFRSRGSKASLNLSNSTSISGLWRGGFRIMTERPVLHTGARFRPQGRDIVIGD